MTGLTARKPVENAWLWLAKILTGLLILIVLLVHFVVNHTLAEGGLLNYAAVVRYLANPWVAAMELSFLTLAVSHSLLGLRGIVLDLHPGPGLLRALDGVLLAVGAGAVLYGFWLTFQIAARAAGG